MLSQILLVLVAWLPTPIARVASETRDRPPTPAQHATVLWLDGEVTVSSRAPAPAPAPDEPEPPAALTPLIGEALAAPATIRVPAKGSLALLVAGERLVRLRAGQYALDERGLRVIAGPTPRATELGGYREGSALSVPPPTSFEPPPEPAIGEVLRITAPAPTVILTQRPLFEWRSSVAGGRFDLTVRRVDKAGGAPANESAEAELVEQWKGLGGRALLATATLRRGGRYRLTIALSGGAAVTRATSRTLEFEVLGAVEKRALDGALEALDALREAGGGGAVAPELEVLRARLFESYGLLADAERIWAALAILEPGHAELRNQARRLEGLIRGG